MDIVNTQNKPSKACFFDLDELLDFEKNELNNISEYSSKRSLVSFIKSENAEIFIIRDNLKKICAYALVSLRHYKIPSGRILKIVVRKDCRRKRLGTILLSEIEKYLIEKQMKKVFAEVRESNYASLKMFQNFSYKKSGTLFGYYGSLTDDYELENAVKLCKILS